MNQILVSEDALNTLKRMVDELQSERDKLYNAVMDVATAETIPAQKSAMDECILLALSIGADANKKVADWQDRMNG